MYPGYKWTDSYPYHTNPRTKETDRGMNLPYYPWPYATNHCYPLPQSCHSCCNHNYFGGPYSFTSPYPHYPPPPPPPFHTHGFYPPFTGPHPAYPVPPPHYSMEQPRYDYDKNTPAPTHHHCCGCEKKSTVDPQEPEFDKKTSESLVPFLKDCPYPVMWVPPSYMNTEKEKEKEKHSYDPVLKPLELSKQRENGENIPQESFPFPIFWLPSNNNEVKKDNFDESTRKNDEEKHSYDPVLKPLEHSKQRENGENINPQESFPFPIFWSPSKNIEVKKDMKEDNVDGKTRKNDDVESEKSNKNGVQKVIPVKQLGTKEEKAKASQKTSKLPPVCLRIDPLPKKKNSSRSPSPPGDKKRLKGSTIEDSESFKQQKTELKNDSKKVEKDSVDDPCSEKGVEQGRSKVEKRKKLSENEAVVMIQSVYRGFEVRKSQPLMKLREIGQVGKQVVELRNRIQDLESSSCIDDKQKLVIGETIMSLLLKLDTIQGLHPAVRDVRKSVAKELVGLQEKLDSLPPSKQTTTTSADEDQTITQPQATESPDDDGGEARNTDLEPQVELQNEENNNNDQMEVEQPVVDHEKTQSDSNDHEVEAVDPTTHHMKLEQLVEQSSGELNNDQVQAAVETDKPVDDVIQVKSDQIPTLMEIEQPVDHFIGHEKAQSDSNDEAGKLDLDDHEVEAADPPTHDMKPENMVGQSSGGLNNDQLQMAVEAEQPLVDVVQEKSDQAQSESGIIVETMESDVSERNDGTEARDINLEPQVGSEEGKQSIVELTGDQPEMAEEINPPAEEEKSDQREALIFKNVNSMENLTPAMDLGTVEIAELGKNDVDLEEAPTVDDVHGGSKEVLMEDLEGAVPLSVTGNDVSSGGDKKLVEENEKLRVAVEELMKAGSEQVSVIRELTGRVKDLEKKLLKRKRKVKKSSRRRRGSVVEEELRSCA